MEALIVYSLFVYFWFHLLSRSDIMESPRKWFIKLVGPKLSYPLQCSFCFTWWTSVVFLLSPVVVPLALAQMLFVAPVINLVLDLVVKKLRVDAESLPSQMIRVWHDGHQHPESGWKS